MQLTEHFALAEFLQSQSAARHGIALVPTPFVVLNLQRLCESILEPLRVAIGRAVTISSGYRNADLNALIGGAPNSSHMTGRAADIAVSGMPTRELAGYIRFHGWPVDKVICEFPDSPGGGWTHVQVSEDALIEPRLLYLTARRVNGQTEYTEGLS